MWEAATVKKLEEYIQKTTLYRVYYKGSQVYNIDLVDSFVKTNNIEEIAIYVQSYDDDDCCIQLSDAKPEYFSIYELRLVKDWIGHANN